MFWNLKEKDNVVWCALLARFHQVLKFRKKNALVDMYAKCRAVDNQKMVFEVMTVLNEFS